MTTTLIRIYTADDARRTVLRRYAPDEQPVPEHITQRLQALFGAPLTPDEAVARILAEVRAEGDVALARWARTLDGYDPSAKGALPVQVDDLEIIQAYDQTPVEVVQALEAAAERISLFHQRQPAASWMMEDLGGVLGQFVRPLERVGVYVPGGSAPLPSSLLMSVIPARVAGVNEVVVCTPCGADGVVPPVVLVAADIAQVDRVYRVGGAQAIGALAYGTASIPRVDKIVGPGNLFVTLAKRRVYGVVGIDGLYGATETVVVADAHANPEWVAADLLAQAEHDVLASAILLTPSAELAEKVQAAIARQIEGLERAEIIVQSLAARGGIVVTEDLAEAVELADGYAPEHLCLAVRDPWTWAPRVRHAGGLFLGEHSFEVLGDYAAGPSHVMPTGGSARFASPLNVWDFVRLTTLVALPPEEAAELSVIAEVLARAEGLTAHAAAAAQRQAE